MKNRQMTDNINSELRYRRLFEAAQDGILILDAETGAIVDVNPFLIKLLGYSREEFIEKRIWEVGAFRDIEASRNAFEALQQNEYIRYDNLPLMTKDGRLIQVEFVSNVYLVEAEKVIQCNIRDITEREGVNTALRVSEGRYRPIFDNLQDAFLVISSDGKISEANLSACRMFGRSLEDIQQVSIHDLIATHESGAEIVHKELSTNNKVRSVLTMYRADGSSFPVEISLTNYTDALGVINTSAIIHDISRRKEAEESLRIGEERLRVTFEATRIASWDWDIKSDTWYGSTQYFSMLGYEPELGATDRKVWLERIFPDDRLIVEGKIKEVLENHASRYEYEARVLHADGTYRWQFVAGHSVAWDANGNTTRMLGIRMDIDARKKSESKAIAAGEFLQSIQDALSANICILDQEGIIVQVNAAWRKFGLKNNLLHSNHCIGTNYLDVCDSATGPNSEEAAAVAKAIREVRDCGICEMRIEYPCHSSTVKRWFLAHITAFENDKRTWIVVIHVDVTERKLAEENVRKQFEHLTALSAIDRIIAANLDLGLSLSEILTHVTMELGVDAAFVMTLNQSSQMLEFGAERGFRSSAIKNAEMRLGEGLLCNVALERQTINILDIRENMGGDPSMVYISGEGFTCYHGVLLIAAGQVKGLLGVFHRSPFVHDGPWYEFLYTLAGQTAIAIENASLFQNLQRTNLEISQAYDTTIEGWSRALDLRDKETEGHTQRVSVMTVKLARSFGLSEAELVFARWGALLHDIGKMGIPDGILLKPGPLTDEEWIVMKKHPALAFDLLSPIHYLRQALDIPHYHHEKWDGSGYPHGLAGIQIPVAARIFAVVDVWDALRSDRPYRAGWSEDKVREHIRGGSGTHFDPQVVDAFMQIQY